MWSCCRRKSVARTRIYLGTLPAHGYALNWSVRGVWCAARRSMRRCKNKSKYLSYIYILLLTLLFCFIFDLELCICASKFAVLRSRRLRTRSCRTILRIRSNLGCACIVSCLSGSKRAHSGAADDDESNAHHPLNPCRWVDVKSTHLCLLILMQIPLDESDFEPGRAGHINTCILLCWRSRWQCWALC